MTLLDEYAPDQDQSSELQNMSSRDNDFNSLGADNMTLDSASVASGNANLMVGADGHTQLQRAEELAARLPRASETNMVMTRQPGLTVRIIRRREEDQRADDEDDGNQEDPLAMAAAMYRL